MAQATLVKRGAYHDSVALLTLARALRARSGVREAAVVMGTPANRDLLAQAGLLTDEAGTASPNDLVVVVEAETPAVAQAAAASVEPRLARSANLALISVPGAFAAAEARCALAAGLNVMLWSDNVSLRDEVALKRDALEPGLLLMGPDCGAGDRAGTGDAHGSPHPDPRATGPRARARPPGGPGDLGHRASPGHRGRAHPVPPRDEGRTGDGRARTVGRGALARSLTPGLPKTRVP